MLKSFYEGMKKSSEEEFHKRPRAWLMFNIQLASTILRAFEEDAKVVWTTYYAFPMELLAAFDVVPFDFEIACNLLPSADPECAVSIMAKAEARGYSLDLCSFHRFAHGSYLLGYLPPADLLLTSSYFCDGKSKTNQILAQHYGKEAIMLDVPNELSQESVAYVSGQLRKIAHKLEEVSGQKLDLDRLRECVRESNRARTAYTRLAEIGKIKPFPWDGSRVVNLSIVGNMFSGTPFQEQLYYKIIEECEQRMGEGKVTPEEFRLLWLAWFPPQRNNINEILRQNKVNIVMSELARVYWAEVDENHPFEGMALRCLKNPYVGPIEQRLNGVLRLLDEYAVDGVVHFTSTACRHANASVRMLNDAVVSRGIPFLDLDGDMSDMRAYSAERTRSFLETFIEVMAARR
jgi:benzoyl-CoA reductase/2-hydroxyglutaryl-CoA dehydratase subunit BcrC/BadD/HgdB